MTMKVSLRGLFANVVNDLPKRQRDYYRFCLDEVLVHLQDVVEGKHTIEEFAKHYCIEKSESVVCAQPPEEEWSDYEQKFIKRY